MEPHPVINEEEYESSKLTEKGEDSENAVVVEESKADTSHSGMFRLNQQFNC